MNKKSKPPTPTMLVWSRQEQRRFSDAIERLHSLIGDLEVILREPTRRAQAASATRAARAAAEAAARAAEAAMPDGHQGEGMYPGPADTL